MLDRTELDIRFASHAAHVDQVNRLGNLVLQSISESRRGSIRQSTATLLLHFANWLAPNQGHESAAA